MLAPSKMRSGCWFQKIGAVNVRKSRWTPQNIRQVHGCSQSWSGHPLRGPRAESALGAGRLILQMHRFLTADFLGQISSVLAQLRTLLLSVHLLGRPGCKTASDMRGYHLKFMLNDLYVFMACATCANRQEHPLWRPSAECKCRACSRLSHLRTTFMFWGPSPLCLACAMSGDADNCREALDAAPARWTAFRTALQKHFKVAPDLYFVQMLPCIWRHFVRMATRRRSAGQVTWKTVARQSVESLWQQLQDKFVQLQDSKKL